jgi:hypothetical protein
LHAASAPAQSARHPHRKMAAQRLMKDTDVAVKETMNGRTTSSRDRMMRYEDLLTPELCVIEPSRSGREGAGCMGPVTSHG